MPPIKFVKTTFTSAADRNKGPILDVLKTLLREHFGDLPFLTDKFHLKCLELGSYTGQHLGHFAEHFPGIQFQPSDMDSQQFDSINAIRQAKNLVNVLPPVVLDLTWPVSQWPVKDEIFDMFYCCNVIHISPWKCSVELFNGAGQLLNKSKGMLILYGAMAVDGVLSPQSNVDFDHSLRKRNPEWGIRDTRKLIELAEKNDLFLNKIIDMPANNKIVVFQRKNAVNQ